ncbi:uncharacterized protein BDW47DRAFT_109099 [Aspergillus candidus]|uniref:Uncharacterized protein n=1 Tax=Aspergillus candidus TaxID=41067 RepID=A0A2I2F6N0_ASPCN|nr:hypothetical protein BDW47DRAFT_109099 [Aspergillus candidus]PLB36299.1 hypothetical protein BDW47DRAFT_109099 [Aspergillus candidus]
MFMLLMLLILPTALFIADCFYSRDQIWYPGRNGCRMGHFCCPWYLPYQTISTLVRSGIIRIFWDFNTTPADIPR